MSGPGCPSLSQAGEGKREGALKCPLPTRWWPWGQGDPSSERAQRRDSAVIPRRLPPFCALSLHARVLRGNSCGQPVGPAVTLHPTPPPPQSAPRCWPRRAAATPHVLAAWGTRSAGSDARLDLGPRARPGWASRELRDRWARGGRGCEVRGCSATWRATGDAQRAAPGLCPRAVPWPAALPRLQLHRALRIQVAWKRQFT